MDQVALSSTPTSSESVSHGDSNNVIGGNVKEYEALFDTFGLTRPTDKQNAHHNKALADIWEYAKHIAPNKDKESVVFEVMRLRNRLGKSGLENNPYIKLEMYVKAWKRGRESDERMQELEGGR